MRPPTRDRIARLSRWTGTVALALLLSAAAAAAEGQAGPRPDSEPRQVRVRADKLVADIDGRIAEFSGNVVVVSGETQIEADFVKLFYDRQAGLEAAQRLEQSAVKKMEARGRVRIRHGEITALTDTAVYDTEKDVLTLEGPETTVSRGKQAIKGARVVLDNAARRAAVAGDGRNRVKAVITTGGRLF